MSEEQKQSAEDKFFGVKTTISKDDDDAPDVEIEESQASPVPSTPPKVEAKPDDDDDELSSYSENVQKRIKKLTWEKNEERRQREAIAAEREEAVRFAQIQQQRVQQQEELIAHGEGYLIQQIKERANAMLQQAQTKYRKAYEEGDTDAIIAAQDEMLNWKAELFSAGQQEQNFMQRVQSYQQQRQQRPPQPFQPRPQQTAKATPQASNWAQENPWFGDPKHKDMTALAYGVHERVVRDEGLKPDTPEYYERIDGEMRQRFPEYFGEGQGRHASTHRNPKSVVAPAGRNNGARPRQVKLTPSAISLAKKLGLTPEQYARAAQAVESKEQ